MPRYQVTAPDGRTVILEGDSPPTDADLDEVFASLPPPQAKADEPGLIGRGLSAVGNVISGAAKEAPLVAMRAANLPRDIVSGAVSLAVDALGNPRVQAADILRAEQESKLRQATETPFQPTAEEGKASKLGRIVAKGAPTAALAALTGGASIPVQAAIAGASQGAQTLSEGGSLGSAALAGGLGAGVGAAAPKVAEVAKSLAPRVINSLIKPLAKQFRFGRDPGRGIVNEGITALTRPQLAKELVGKLDELGLAIEQNLTAPGTASKTIDIRPALAEVDKAITEGAKRGERALLDRLKNLRQALTNELDPATGEWSRAKPMALSPLDAHRLKREVGEAAKWTGQAFDNEVNQARVAFYRKLNSLIDEAAPGTKALQARYADILTAQSSLERMMTMQGRNNLLSLPDVILGTGGLAASAINPAAGIAGAAGILGRHVAGSAGAKTVAAQLLARFPNLSPELQAAIRAGLGGQATAD